VKARVRLHEFAENHTIEFPLACEYHQAPVLLITKHSDESYRVAYSCALCHVDFAPPYRENLVIEIASFLGFILYEAPKRAWFWIAFAPILLLCIWGVLTNA